jgi:hypothetical protein
VHHVHVGVDWKPERRRGVGVWDDGGRRKGSRKGERELELGVLEMLERPSPLALALLRILTTK